MYSGIGPGLLGLEMPLQPKNPQPSQNPQSLHLHHHHHHPQLAAFGGHGGDPDHHPQHQQPGKQGYPFASKPKPTSPQSDEDEAGDGGGDPKRKISPWQRMKWTDNMVRLLIMAVYYIGDEFGSEASDSASKKKAGGLLQKKGKWKSVSRAMMEKGFYVSPQQCEDKFNDLNKRYKRVNDILGRGTACRVVENQRLLESMDLSLKLKEEARKLLNSKHLFFKEMCAYHNSCGHGAPPAGPAASSHSTEMAANEPSHVQQQSQQPLCYHSSENSQMAVNSCRNEGEGLKLMKAGSEEEDQDEDDESEDDEEDGDEEEVAETPQSGGHGQEDDNENKENSSHKRRRKGPAFPLIQQLSAEVASMMQDGSKSAWEKKQWVRMRLIQLEEQRAKYQYQAFELEKQRLKWIKFSSKKEREMERSKLENERGRLETERMVLLVRHKEMELVAQHQQTPNRRADPSTITG